MRKRTGILLLVFTALLTISSFNTLAQTRAVRHDNKKIEFESGHFKVVGELRIPSGEGKYPLVIMVHGDGPAYRSYFYTLKKCFLRAGYATMMWDKPGTGQSTGKFSRKHLRAERAEILRDAIESVKSHPRIDPNRIGVWGISQAGYVIPRALQKTDDITFMILVGVAGQNGIEQTAFFVSQQIQCEGFSEDEAKEAERLAVNVLIAKTYEEYVTNGKVLLEKYPIVKDLDFMAGILPEERWTPKDPEGESYFNPISIIEQTKIPSLVILGEKDRNVNPLQAVEAYNKALSKSGSPNFRVELIPGTDHNIILCETGCQKERNKRSRKEWANYAPEYLELMEDWLKRL
jgi:dipeptidyl aminopeptidase/acylaminoacyl peptidase